MNEAVAQAASQTNFSALDWGIVVAYMAVSLVIGLLVKRYATNMTAYIAAGQSVGVWLGVATMTGTELGLVTVMYSAEKGFKGGFAAFHIAVLAGIVTFFVGVTGFIVAPLRELGVHLHTGVLCDAKARIGGSLWNRRRAAACRCRAGQRPVSHAFV